MCGLVACEAVSHPTEGDAVVTPRRGSRHLHALLDAVLPGLGHLAAGRRRRAAAFGVPAAAALLSLAALLLLTPTSRLLGIALDPVTIAAVFALQLLVFVWRIAAVGSSLLDGRFPRLGRGDVLPVALLAAVLVVPQAYAGIATEVAREEADRVIPIAPITTGAWRPAPSVAPTPSLAPGFSAIALPSGSLVPSASPPPTVPRQNVLIIGVDQGIGRNTFSTDTMIVVSLDPVGETVSMISIPRDMVDVPLPDGRAYRGKINGLLSWARHHPGEFPGSNGSGQDVLMGAVGTLLGLKIDHFAQVNLGGFIRVVDALGGIDVDVRDGFCDPTYREYGYPDGFSITAGRHHLNGQQALAFARVRKAAGESDFTRAARQQELLSGVRDRVNAGGFLNDPIGLMRALGATVETNIPRALVPELAEAATKIGRKQTYRAVIGSGLVHSALDGRGSVQLPDIAGIRRLAATLFPEPGTLPVARYQVPTSSGGTRGSGVSNCADAPRATPRPTPRPTTKLTPKPSGTTAPTASPTSTPAPTPTPDPTPDPQPSDEPSPSAG